MREAKDADKLKRRGADADGKSLNVKDSRFSALFNSADFALDPTDPRYKNAAGSVNVIRKEKQRRTVDSEEPLSVKPKKSEAAVDAEMGALVSSLKRKAITFDNKKKKLQNKP